MKISRCSYFTRLSRDEKLLFNVAGTISVWEIDGEKPIEKYRLNTLKNPDTLTLSSDEKLLAFSNTSGYLAVAETETGTIISKSKGIKDEGGNIVVYPDNTRVLSSDRKGNIFTWDITSGEINILVQLPIILTELFSCYQGTKVIIVGNDSKSESGSRYLRLWEMALEGEYRPKEIQLNRKYDAISRPRLCIVESECFFFDESKGEEMTVFSLNLDSKEIKEVINVHPSVNNKIGGILGDYGSCTSLCVSTDKKYLLLGFSKAVIAFDLMQKEYLGILRYGSTHAVSDLNFFANNTKILISKWNNIQAMDFPSCFLPKSSNKKS